ncbi:hypothetical protein EJB05_15758 [Eragrostis curvula]|uniref:Uncharacterized protein n=1 Tax=Eragrostis curvula TaxID=38414 RepID=A0A5J9VCD4_9POAL|nr:hypothetical protein EJB05_15758 [Eragrostis curvula]
MIIFDTMDMLIVDAKDMMVIFDVKDMLVIFDAKNMLVIFDAKDVLLIFDAKRRTESRENRIDGVQIGFKPHLMVYEE